MIEQNDSLAGARQRIEAAYDPRLVQAAGRTLADLLSRHLGKVQRCESAVLNWADPQTYTAEAALIADSEEQRAKSEGPIEGLSAEDLARRFGELVRISLSRGINLHDPRYVGHQVPASIPIA